MSSVEALVWTYGRRLGLSRIEGLMPDRARASALGAFISVNENALREARERDRAPNPDGVLWGFSLGVKDNIGTADAMPTTAGSYALDGNFTGDAFVVARLRAVGVIVLGKTGLGEWGHARFGFDDALPRSSWSPLSGYVYNPHSLNHSVGGSSGGSAAAVAADLVPLAIGTDTFGSITAPASYAGVVGMRPTYGLVSRSGVIPYSYSLDTVGPLAQCVSDAALLLTVMAGTDPDDPTTAQADAHAVDYTAALSPDALRGKRLGVWRLAPDALPEVDHVFEIALRTLRDAGADVLPVEAPDQEAIWRHLPTVLATELKAGLDAYLGALPPGMPVHSLDELVQFNREDPREYIEVFGQTGFERAARTRGLRDPEYQAALSNLARVSRTEGLDRIFRENELDGIVAPTTGPPNHLRAGGAGPLYGSSLPPAAAGFAHVSVPTGNIGALPINMSVICPPWHDADALAIAYAYEQLSHKRIAPMYRADRAEKEHLRLFRRAVADSGAQGKAIAPAPENRVGDYALVY